MPEADVARLLDVLRRLRARGIGIIYVTHRLDEVFRIADRVTVLRDGRRVATDAVADTTPGALVHDIVGRSLAELFIKPTATTGDAVLAVDELSRREVGPVSFRVAAGEIVGLVGLRGAGHDVVGRALFGDVPIGSGTMMLAGTCCGRARRAMRSAGIGFVSSKRGEESLARSMTVRENLFINPVTAGAGLLSRSRPAPSRRARAASWSAFGVARRSRSA